MRQIWDETNTLIYFETICLKSLKKASLPKKNYFCLFFVEQTFATLSPYFDAFFSFWDNLSQNPKKKRSIKSNISLCNHDKKKLCKKLKKKNETNCNHINAPYFFSSKKCFLFNIVRL